MITLESRVRAKLERFSALVKARDPATADELGRFGAPLLGSEAHEQYFTRDEIAVHIDEIFEKPFVLTFDWKTVRPTQQHPIIWAIVEADMVLNYPNGDCRAMPYRLICIFEEIDGELQWRLFSGSEPAAPPTA
jgi:hypothetical protein